MSQEWVMADSLIAASPRDESAAAALNTAMASAWPVNSSHTVTWASIKVATDRELRSSVPAPSLLSRAWCPPPPPGPDHLPNEGVERSHAKATPGNTGLGRRDSFIWDMTGGRGGEGGAEEGATAERISGRGGVPRGRGWRRRSTRRNRWRRARGTAAVRLRRVRGTRHAPSRETRSSRPRDGRTSCATDRVWRAPPPRRGRGGWSHPAAAPRPPTATGHAPPCRRARGQHPGRPRRSRDTDPG